MINIEEYLGLVGMKAKKYISMLEYDDAFQQGCVGLLKAKEYFKEDMGYEFSTYAGRMIEGYILQYLRDKNSVIKIPREIGDLNSKINRMTINGKTQEEICEELNLTKDKFKEAKNCYGIAFSINNTFQNDDGVCSFEELTDDGVNMEESIIFSDNIYEALNKLNKKLRDVVILSFIYGYTQKEIAEKYNITQSAVQRRIGRTLKKLRDSLV